MTTNNELPELVDKHFLDVSGQRVYLYERKAIDISDVLRCHRMRFFKYKGAPSDPWDAASLRMFKMGDIVENLLYQVFDKAGILRRTQQYIVSRIDERIRGKLDFVLTLKGRNHVVEVKSQGDFPYQKRTKKKDPQPLNERYVAQALTYVDTLLQHPKEEIDDTALIVETRRSDLTLHTTPVQYTKESWQPIEADWKKMLEYVDKDELPPPIEGFPAVWECSSCRFRTECIRLYREQIK